MVKWLKTAGFLLVLAGCLACAGPAQAESLKKDLDSVQYMLEKRLEEEKDFRRKASSAAQEVYDTRQALIETAKKIQDFEAQVSKMEADFEELKIREQQILETIKERNQQIVQMMAVLQSISIRPVESLLLQNIDPVSTLRSSLLLRDTVPLITRETDKLKKEIDSLAAVREKIRLQYLKIKNTAESLKEQQKQADILLQRKISLQKDLEKKAVKSRQEAQALARKAKDLQGLILEIENQNREKEKEREKERGRIAAASLALKKADFGKMKGRLALPVKGDIVTRYGERLESGMASKGILIKGRPGAQVIAPFDGEVVFSGPFRNYKDMLIISYGKEHYMLLAGMEKNDTTLGQSLLAGEPVGTLPGDHPSLYVEIRRKGNALNPEGWFVKNR